MQKLTILFIINIVLLLGITAGGAFYVFHLRSEINRPTKTTHTQRGAPITTPLGETPQQALDKCIANANATANSEEQGASAVIVYNIEHALSLNIQECQLEYPVSH